MEVDMARDILLSTIKSFSSQPIEYLLQKQRKPFFKGGMAAPGLCNHTAMLDYLAVAL